MNKKIISHLNNRSIVLVGMMGSGKTTIGKLLAEELKLPFYDSDYEIEKNLGKKINDIFKEHGELFFRNEELNFFEEKINQTQIIISSGGGSFVNKEIQKRIKKDCISIWLKASKETLVNRLKNKKNRPLLNVENFEDTLSLLLNERNAIYEKADLTITIDKLDKVKILQAIIKSLESLK
tara:strand:+ start:248 stop:787 length:540 start_codon:yes stop_codon:yes gene_type:complete